MGLICGRDQTLNFGFFCIRPDIAGFRESTRVQFYELAADAPCGFDLRRVRGKEKADFDPAVFQATDRFRKGFLLTQRVQTAFGCDFLTAFRNDADDVRFQSEGDLNDFRIVGHFHVESRLDLLAQCENIPVLNVTAILSQMSRDAVCACLFTQQSNGDRIRFTVGVALVAGLPQGGGVIYIDT